MKTISNRGLISAIVTIINGSVLITVLSLSVTVQEAWLTVIAAVLISLAMVLIYTSLIKRFPGLSLTEMIVSLFGRYLGTFISFLYLVFFVFLASVATHDLIIYFNGYILPKTPLWVLSLLFILVCAFAVFKGIDNIFNLCFIILIIYSGAIILNTLLLIKEMDFSNFLPLFVHSAKEYLHGTAIITTFPFCETVAILMLAPFLANPQKCRRPFITGILIGGFVFLLLLVRDIAVLGPLVSNLSLPSYEAVRMINVLDVFTRLEVIFGFILIIEYFSKVSLLYFISAHGFQNLLNLKKNSMLIVIIGVAVVLISVNVFKSEGQEILWSKGTGLLTLGVFEIVIPLIMWITAIIKKKKVRKAIES